MFLADYQYTIEYVAREQNYPADRMTHLLQGVDLDAQAATVVSTASFDSIMQQPSKEERKEMITSELIPHPHDINAVMEQLTDEPGSDSEELVAAPEVYDQFQGVLRKYHDGVAGHPPVKQMLQNLRAHGYKWPHMPSHVAN